MGFTGNEEQTSYFSYTPSGSKVTYKLYVQIDDQMCAGVEELQSLHQATGIEQEGQVELSWQEGKMKLLTIDGKQVTYPDLVIERVSRKMENYLINMPDQEGDYQIVHTKDEMWDIQSDILRVRDASYTTRQIFLTKEFKKFSAKIRDAEELRRELQTLVSYYRDAFPLVSEMDLMVKDNQVNLCYQDKWTSIGNSKIEPSLQSMIYLIYDIKHISGGNEGESFKKNGFELKINSQYSLGDNLIRFWQLYQLRDTKKFKVYQDLLQISRTMDKHFPELDKEHSLKKLAEDILKNEKLN